MTRFAPAAAVIVVAFGAHGADGASTPRFAFGRSGGNIVPFTVAISGTGRISARGPVSPSRTSVPRRTLRSLLPLARREGFFTMPPTIVCSGTLPDFASFFVAVTTSSGTKRVSVRGSCNRRFADVYAKLSSAAGMVP